MLGSGGLTRDLAVPPELPAEIRALVKDFNETVEICLNNTLVRDRLEGTGALGLDSAKDHGVLGYVARASGIDVDARRDHPFAAYQQLRFSVPVMTGGDVKARALVRVEAVQQSMSLIEQACGQPAPGAVGERFVNHSVVCS